MYTPTDNDISFTVHNMHLYCDHTLYSLPLYTFLWPEDGPHWPKHVVVSTINRIQDSCILTYRTPSLNNYFLPQHQLKILLTSHKSSFAVRCTYLCTYTTGIKSATKYAHVLAKHTCQNHTTWLQYVTYCCGHNGHSTKLISRLIPRTGEEWLLAKQS